MGKMNYSTAVVKMNEMKQHYMKKEKRKKKQHYMVKRIKIKNKIIIWKKVICIKLKNLQQIVYIFC